MIGLKADNFDLAQIAGSGQCFRMTGREDGSYEVIALDRRLVLRSEGDKIVFDCGNEDFEGFWRHYFDLDTDYGAFISAIDPDDMYLTAAASFGKGIRILNQDIWEMLVTFLISQQNNIPRIRRCISNICEKYGEKRDGYYAFPIPESLASLPEDALMACNLGYRSKYVVRCARDVAEGRTDLNALRALPYEEARAALMGLYGVGKKVADCICLFALHTIDAFPIDTHIRRVLEQHYQKGFPFERYAGFAGVLQQYIFYYDLNSPAG